MVSRLQMIAALSSMQVECVVVTKACNELIWLKNFMKELDKKQVTSALYTDNQSGIDLTNNPVYHEEQSKLMCDITSPTFF